MTEHQRIISSLFATDGTRKYLTSSEIKRFLYHAAKHDAHINLLCQVLAYSGCRLTEALRLTTMSIDLEAQALTFQTLKQRRSNVFRHVPMPNYILRNLLKNAERGGRTRIWPVHRQTGRRWVQRVMHTADLSGVRATTRGLRHGFAVGNVEDDIPVTILQKWMGHARLATTAIYTNATGPEELGLAERRWVTLEC